MKLKLDRKLFKRFKFFQPELPLTESLMAFGFEVGDGWFKLIWQLCEDLEKMIPDGENFRVLQVKEKYGTLRFYTNWSTDKMEERIDMAEQESAETCEVCGKPGKLYDDGWCMTRCERCRKLE